MPRIRRKIEEIRVGSFGTAVALVLGMLKTSNFSRALAVLIALAFASPAIAEELTPGAAQSSIIELGSKLEKLKQLKANSFKSHQRISLDVQQHELEILDTITK